MSESAIWNELGTLHCDAGSFDRAIKAYRKALEIDSTYGPALINLAIAQARQGNYSEAIPLYIRSLTLQESDDNQRATAWNQLGIAYQMVSDYVNALSAFQEAVSLDPDNEVFQRDLAALRIAVEKQGVDVPQDERGESLSAPVLTRTDDPNDVSASLEVTDDIPVTMLSQEQAVPQTLHDLPTDLLESHSREELISDTGRSLPAESGSLPDMPTDLGVTQAVAYPDSPDAPISEDLVDSPVLPEDGQEISEADGSPEREQLISGGETQSVWDVCVEEIFPNPLQPRLRVDVDDLVDSVREHGVLQPLLVTPGESKDRYVLIAGERRLEAARQAGLDKVPVIVHDVGDQQRLELALIENVQRSNLSALELAEAYHCLVERFGLSHAEIAERMGKSRVSITNTLRLLRLPEDVKRALAGGRISEGHARALLSLTGESFQVEALQFILQKGFSVRQTEVWVRERATKQESITIPQPVLPAMDQDPGEIASILTPARQCGEPPVESSSPQVEHAPLQASLEGETREDNDLNPPGPPGSEMGAVTERDDPDIAKMMGVWLSLDVPPVDPPVPAVSKEQVPGFSEDENAEASSGMLPDDLTSDDGWMPIPTPASGEQTPVDQVADRAVPVLEANQEETGKASQVEDPEPAIELPPAPAVKERVSSVRTSRSDTIYLQGVLSTYKRVTKTNPQNGPAWDILGDLHCSLGQYEEAIAAFERAIALNPENEDYHYHLGTAYMVQKRYNDAVVQFQEAVRLNPECVYARSALASSYRHLGRDREAQEHLRIVAPHMELEKEYNRACFESIRGNVSKALEFLRQSIDKKQASLDQVRNDPDFDFLRDNPNFLALVGSPGYAS